MSDLAYTRNARLPHRAGTAETITKKTYFDKHPWMVPIGILAAGYGASALGAGAAGSSSVTSGAGDMFGSGAAWNSGTSGLGATAPTTGASSTPAWLNYLRMGNMANSLLGGMGGQQQGAQQPMFGPGVVQVPQAENRNPYAGWPGMNPFGPDYGRY